MHRALASPVLTDGTKQGLATFIPVPKKFLIFLGRYKELLLFIMSVGYAESSIFRFIICIVSFKRHPPPSETFADYLQDDKQI